MKKHEFISLADDKVRLALRYDSTSPYKDHMQHLFGVGILLTFANIHTAEDFCGLTDKYKFAIIGLDDARKLRDTLDEVIKEADHEL